MPPLWSHPWPGLLAALCSFQNGGPWLRQGPFFTSKLAAWHPQINLCLSDTLLLPSDRSLKTAFRAQPEPPGPAPTSRYSTWLPLKSPEVTELQSYALKLSTFGGHCRVYTDAGHRQPQGLVRTQKPL